MQIVLGRVGFHRILSLIGVHPILKVGSLVVAAVLGPRIFLCILLMIIFISLILAIVWARSVKIIFLITIYPWVFLAFSIWKRHVFARSLLWLPEDNGGVGPKLMLVLALPGGQFGNLNTINMARVDHTVWVLYPFTITSLVKFIAAVNSQAN